MKTLLWLVLLTPALSLAQVQPVKLVDGNKTVNATTTSSGAVALKVDCVQGCAASGGSPLTDAELRATPVPVSGTVTTSPSGTQTVSGTVTVTDGAGPVTVDGTVAVTGTFWQATQPVSGTFWQATQPISASTLPLPTGAATSAKQPALGTAGSASADVITVQGAASMTALKVDGSAVTQPVSGTFWQATQPVSGTVTANQGGSPWGTNQTQINGVTVSTGIGPSTTGTQRIALIQQATYAAATTLKTATAAGTGVWFSICGSDSKTVRIRNIKVSATVGTTAVYADIVLRKTSSAPSGGTATALTKTPFDSNSAAGTATAINFYTVLATGAGTLVGTIDTQQIFAPVTATPALAQPAIFDWTNNVASEAPVLRGSAQCVTANFGTTTTNAPTIAVSVAWTEE